MTTTRNRRRARTAAVRIAAGTGLIIAIATSTGTPAAQTAAPARPALSLRNTRLVDESTCTNNNNCGGDGGDGSGGSTDPGGGGSTDPGGGSTDPGGGTTDPGGGTTDPGSGTTDPGSGGTTDPGSGGTSTNPGAAGSPEGVMPVVTITGTPDPGPATAPPPAEQITTNPDAPADQLAAATFQYTYETGLSFADCSDDASILVYNLGALEAKCVQGNNGLYTLYQYEVPPPGCGPAAPTAAGCVAPKPPGE
jgi:hypothetical protein